ncbi:hypothetical protein Pint_20042 [Pistacia integerrima]|uniref:Uncharacterized protein n=1 Tax=Pistacia integerrima TaxID=434235 RepID=A0ACC0XAD9_9ROSI|nr:hypothetical protein Pint_20042 [Pistacia integerrima]
MIPDTAGDEYPTCKSNNSSSIFTIGARLEERQVGQLQIYWPKMENYEDVIGIRALVTIDFHHPERQLGIWSQCFSLLLLISKTHYTFNCWQQVYVELFLISSFNSLNFTFYLFVSEAVLCADFHRI